MADATIERYNRVDMVETRSGGTKTVYAGYIDHIGNWAILKQVTTKTGSTITDSRRWVRGAKPASGSKTAGYSAAWAIRATRDQDDYEIYQGLFPI